MLKSPRDFNLTREAVLGTTLDPHTPAFDLQRACGTSLETAIVLGLKIAAGQIDCGIAAGVDTASDAPIGINENLRHIMLRSARGRDLGARLKPWLALRPGHVKPDFPAVVEPRTGLTMGQSCELMARHWAIPREEQDRLALESHRSAAKAYDRGFFQRPRRRIPWPAPGRQPAARHDAGKAGCVASRVSDGRHRHADGWQLDTDD